MINNVKIDIKERTKFLGVIIDKHLSFQSHIKYIKGKVARGFGILYECRPYFNSETMRTLYNCFIYPYFTYCIEEWGNACQSYWKPLIILQKRTIRMVAGDKKLDHTLPLFHSLNLLQINEIYVYCVQLFMYKYHHDCLPNVFYDFYVRNNSVHDHQTRQPLIRTQPLSKTIRVTGVVLYNHFFNLIGLGTSYATYKTHLRKHIINYDTKTLV